MVDTESSSQTGLIVTEEYTESEEKPLTSYKHIMHSQLQIKLCRHQICSQGI